MAATRISHEPAYVLHRYDFSETSLILEVFTRNRGRIALVAKGAKRPSSNFRPVLLPLQPLELSFSGDAEIRTLKGAEWVGGHVMPTGEALLAGTYLNELLMRLLARDDPHPQLFDVYAAAVRVLAARQEQALEPALRAFELLLLRHVGLLPLLNRQTLTLAPLEAGARYTLVPEGGLRAADANEQRGTLDGAEWSSLQQALDDPEAPFLAALRACAALLPGLKPQLRLLLNHHCGGIPLRTRQMMVELQKL